VIGIISAKTVGTGAPAPKTPVANGVAPAVGQVAANLAGTSITFNAETTGTGTCDVTYVTGDPTKVGGITKKAINDPTYAGVF
jgi:hypothetical protein